MEIFVKMETLNGEALWFMTQALHGEDESEGEGRERKGWKEVVQAWCGVGDERSMMIKG